jgi:hypothetical protein
MLEVFQTAPLDANAGFRQSITFSPPTSGDYGFDGGSFGEPAESKEPNWTILVIICLVVYWFFLRS